MRPRTETPAKTPNPMGRTESCVPGRTKAATVALCSAAAAVALASVLLLSKRGRQLEKESEMRGRETRLVVAPGVESPASPVALISTLLTSSPVISTATAAAVDSAVEVGAAGATVTSLAAMLEIVWSESPGPLFGFPVLAVDAKKVRVERTEDAWVDAAEAEVDLAEA